MHAFINIHGGSDYYLENNFYLYEQELPLGFILCLGICAHYCDIVSIDKLLFPVGLAQNPLSELSLPLWLFTFSADSSLYLFLVWMFLI
jgi:hypothetical protein